MNYTISDIRSAWEEYNNRQVLKYALAGEKFLIDLDGKRFTAPQGAIRPEIKRAVDVYSFPEFLEKKWKS